MPSVSPTVTVACLLPQPAANRAQSSAAEMTSRRLMARILDARDRGARAAIVVLLEDRLQPLQGLAPATLEPAARAAQALHYAVGRQCRLALGRVLDLGAAARRRERPGRVGLVAVELAAAPGGHDPIRPRDLDEGHVLPAEAVEALVAAEAGARALAHGLDARQAPVLEVVIGELRVVRDVGEVVEDLLARTADGGRAGRRPGPRRGARARRLGASGDSASMSRPRTRRAPSRAGRSPSGRGAWSGGGGAPAWCSGGSPRAWRALPLQRSARGCGPDPIDRVRRILTRRKGRALRRDRREPDGSA